MTAKSELPPIRFKELAEALLARADVLVPAWLPGGKHQKPEYVCGSLSGGKGTSCSVNMISGKWGDFATGEQGGDLIGLYAAIHQLPVGKAAVQVARDEGLEDVAGVRPDPAHQRVERPPPPPAAPKPPRADEGWTTQRPVPAHAPPVNFKHHHRSETDIEHVAEYRAGGELHGYVVRFRTSDGGKDTLPRTWCISQKDGAAKWHWKQFDEPRPLYLPGRGLPGGRTVVLVEGEVKADVLQELLEQASPGVYCVASWPGGSKAWEKADWTWLNEAAVLLWPDCDAKREALTKAERESCADDMARAVLQQSKPLLPPEKQPGLMAMLGIGARLRDVHQCHVHMLPIPAPGEVVDGWDCKDAIKTDGWDGDRVLAFFGRAQPLQAVPAAPAPKNRDRPVGTGGSGNGDAGGGGGGDEGLNEHGIPDDEFGQYIAFICEQANVKPWELGVNRKMVIEALRRAPALKGCLGFNELTGAPCTTRPWPWREKAGPLADSDDLRLGDWITATYKLKAASRASLAEALDTVADSNHFHPFRDWLQSLEWDGVPRLDKWLRWVLRKDPESLTKHALQQLTLRQDRFLALMGRYILLGHVARVMEPGTKFDYSPVLEGVPGVGKSTMIKVLVGAEYFSDTHFDIGNGKDGMEQLEGLLAYELSEMTAFRRADSEQIKQFFSSTIDRFRGAYGKYVQPHPRQCLIWCTTNKRQYLFDLTGNRRFWPVWCDLPLRIQWLTKWREQLFAEAMAVYLARERIFPTEEEEETFFRPEQEKRLVETTVQSKLYELLTREGAKTGEGKMSAEISVLTTFVTLPMLVTALGADAAKSTSLLESQIRTWLEVHKWEYRRESKGQRRRGFFQPSPWPPEFKEHEETDLDKVPGQPEAPPPAQADPPEEESDDTPF